MKKIFYLILLLTLAACKDQKENVAPVIEPAAEFQQLTNYTEGVNSVVISDDGLTIFYTVHKSQDSMGNYIGELYSMNSDGSNKKKILNFISAIGLRPVLSKNNSKIAFITSKNTNTSAGPIKEIIVGNFDGTNLTTLHPIMDGFPILIAFVENDQSLLYGNSIIVNNCSCNTTWKMNISDFSTKMLSGNGKVRAVSKDQSLLLVESHSEAFTMDMNGQNIVQLGNKFVPWDISPDNSSILMHKVLPWVNGSNAVSMFVSNANGTSNLQLTNTEGTSLPHSFFPNGQEILFSYYKGPSGQGDSELFSIKPDGTGQQRLTNNNVDEGPIGFLEHTKKVLLTISENRISNLYVLKLK